MLDQAVKIVPRIYEAMTQSLASPLSDDPFVDLAAALRGAAKSEEAAAWLEEIARRARWRRPACGGAPSIWR